MEEKTLPNNLNKKNLKCDVCDKLIITGLAVLQANWEHPPKPQNKQFEIFLCEICFLGTLAHLRLQRRMEHLFDENYDFSNLGNLKKIDSL
ncbi:hypothetical protein ABTD72_01785 [Acinetobacter baumannii]